MGKRMAVIEAKHVTPVTRIIRKRKRNSGGVTAGSEVIAESVKAQRRGNYWHESDDEDSSSNDATNVTPLMRNQSTKQANNSSILLSANTSVNESPKPVYTLLPSVVNGTIMYDLMQKPWRLGKPIGKGNFGEIFLASDNITMPVNNENAKFVVKIEPHSNGPLFVEIHCLMNTAKDNSNHLKEENDNMNRQQDIAASLPQNPPSGIPKYIASGSHYFGDARYRFLVLQRFDRDLHSIIKNCRVHQKSVLTLAIQIVNVLENLHGKGYCHNDVKAQNLMISKCKYYKKQTATAPVTTGNGKSSRSNLKSSKYDEHYEEKQQTTDSGNSSEQEVNDDEEDDDDDADFVVKRNMFADEDEDEDFDDGETTNSNNSNSVDNYVTPVSRNRKRRPRTSVVEYSGSNPVRSCRRQKRNSIYEEMVKSHYLRPTKRISYSEFFTEDGISIKDDTADSKSITSDDDSEEFIPRSARRLATNKKSSHSSNTYVSTTTKRLTRRQEKLINSLNASKHLHSDTSNSNLTTTAVAESLVAVEEERIFLIDFGLASKFMDNGVHRPFVMDQRRAHDGTLEFTSRDAHMGAHSRRSDLECLGYNLIFWSQGYLPWKDAATQHQQEKVHRAKEYLMTDVREMLKQIYGKQVPKYLGEFLHQVGQLAYHDQPDYARYRRLFEREFQQLGYSLAELRLDSDEIARSCVRVKEEIENKNDIFEMNKHNGNAAWSIMKNLSVGTPFHERTLSNRVSPKNLRSKSDKKSLKKKKFSWAEILSQDPDQIARERAEKEFDREEELSEVQQAVVRRYEGKPTYAILEIQQRLRSSGRLVEENGNSQQEDNENQTDEDEDEDNDDEEQEEDDEEEEVMEIDAEEDCDDENDDDVDTDATDPMLNGGHNTRAHNTRSTRVKVSKASELECRIRSSGKQRSKCTIKTTVTASKLRTSNNSTITASKPATKSSSKRASANAKRSNRKGCTNDRMQNNGHATGNSSSVSGRPERRTRRCLIKTEPEVDDLMDQQESNSNFSPDVCSLFNVWNKINNENIYYRGSNAATAASNRHCKK
ncbi:uncharacterized protein LOC129245829 [Anastrepha obliqua]|uniref:uncharacterized protein LOC129245829 n=1 Tax=Anastrepha obliqua TaxID=95512 RepID=UPI00240957F1|nr:uncharacterized protein LOC129245829 [Anastrepha obliqua]XP_054740216.1 uncharacterized protein LOC129245829 [Anastrepha obliqua]XP_054740218.1 uncharacterized protein LOC129245829 [Anastrepha obliqua]XP_054740219.1 uncharacterized protein LOC129245829 [Anastrepha obliqua]XP_054740220.1 uncharacterized protein LOC129245829 [Anastrepha obliqua]XP_054740221.1 uncharacterized protein LOC129245829 [Anastrepha obliqua]